MNDNRMLLVGNPDEVHLGSHLRRAAESLGLPVRLCDSTEAFAGSLWRQKVAWWARGRRPARLRDFSAGVVETAKTWRPRYLVTTGISPVDAPALTALGALGIIRVNVLTDDPWNPVHEAPWFMDALPLYDHVCSPRRLNLPDLAALCGRPATYLPFAYAPDVHFPQAPVSTDDRRRFQADLMFAGGADPDRVHVLGGLIRAGLRVALYGGYWDKYPETRAHARGMLDAAGLRMATAGAKVCICLVRRANRDGHSMRSFEVPAMRGCMLVEGTDDHRAMFGRADVAAVFFESLEAAVEQARALVRDDDRCVRLAESGHRLMTSGGQTYQDRLTTLLQVAASAGRLASAEPVSVY